MPIRKVNSEERKQDGRHVRQAAPGEIGVAVVSQTGNKEHGANG